MLTNFVYLTLLGKIFNHQCQRPHGLSAGTGRQAFHGMSITVEVSTPDECMGAVIGDLNSRRGRIQDTVPKAHGTIIKAAVPLAEMLKYAPVLNSLTGGRATYAMDLLTYEEVPRELVPKVLEEHKTTKAVAAH